jgi:transcriptional regulator with XRE-family HTH domain
VRVTCHLRGFRGDRTLAAITEQSGVSQADLSRIERGRMVPADDQVALLEEAYGQPRHLWWPPEVLVVLQDDEGAV